MVDPWITLTAIAMNTKRIRFGPSVTPIARRRPWKLARETATLDNLSGGCLILGVGLGAPADAEFAYFGEEPDARTRAAKLDEGLEILAGLWRGKPFAFQGKHFQIQKTVFLPTPLQKPRIPIWVGGWWPNPAPFRRAARWDGVIPLKTQGPLMTPDDVREMLRFIREHRASDQPFDVAIIGSRETRGKGGVKGAAKVAQFAEAGATWWLESLYLARNSVEKMRAAIRLGPPRS
jgi:alkanesulfonate monooxygenase SsuD/methylene tetrahydromethanopterin reductase-like flavin-dependent oxidoreductase (luciferase family)